MKGDPLHIPGVNPWILIFPTCALAIVVYSMNMFGDALRDEIDPRLRGSR